MSDHDHVQCGRCGEYVIDCECSHTERTTYQNILRLREILAAERTAYSKAAHREAMDMAVSHIRKRAKETSTEYVSAALEQVANELVQLKNVNRAYKE